MKLELVTPKILIPQLPISGPRMAVRWKLEVVDQRGRRIRPPQMGVNMVTDWGMDQLGANGVIGAATGSLLDYLAVGSATETLKRIGNGTTELTVTWADASDIDLATNTNFFEEGDVGRTFQIGTASWPELVIDTYTDAQNVHAHARNNAWLPGFTPPASPAGPYTDFGCHYTATPTMASEFTRFATYDTGVADYRADVNDSSNDRWICQRIFLSATVTGSPWTVNELAWGVAATNCFGKANMASPETVPVGNKLRVTLQVFAAYTPIDLTGFSANWGATIGTHTLDIRQERIGNETLDGFNGSPPAFNYLRAANPSASNSYTGAWTSAFTLDTINYYGDVGFTSLTARTRDAQASGGVTTGSYSNGTFTKTRTARWPDTVSITNATGLYIGSTSTGNPHYPWLSLRKQSGTLSKASGYWMEIAFPIHWTRALPN